MYQKRLAELRKVLNSKLENAYGSDLHVINTTQLSPGNKCCVIGCIIKVFKNESSFIEVLENPQMAELFPKFENFEKCDQDKIFIEDHLGRV